MLQRSVLSAMSRRAMTAVLFEVTDDDLARLTGDEFDGVWMALGIVVRSRTRLAPEPVASEPVPAPAPVTTLPVVDPAGRTAGEQRRAVAAAVAPKGRPGGGPTTCPDCGKPMGSVAGMSAHRRTQHRKPAPRPAPVAAAVPAPVVATTDFAARAKAAADRAWREAHADEVPA